MRYLFGFLCVFALCVAPLLGCSEPAGDGGMGGQGGMAGSGGDGLPRFDPLQGIGTVELVADGFGRTEGPTWRAAEQTLLFSDIPAQTIYELTPPNTISVFRADTGGTNGLDSDVDGLLLVAEHGNRRVSRTLPDGTIVDVASEYRGDLLNSPNDIAVRSDGTIYFTDPPYFIAETEQVLEFNGVFRVDPAGELTAEWEGAKSTRPNGLVFSPDERILYVAQTEGSLIEVMAFDVDPDGSLSGERTFVDDVPFPDGMAMDTGGNLYVAAIGGVWVYDPEGSLWGIIQVPGNLRPFNCAFGDDDARTLYITAGEVVSYTGGVLYEVSLVHPGLY